MSQPQTQQRVIVIGAGMAGLACARELQQRRYKVLLVEARSRIGGRVWGAPLQSIDDEQMVDLGGALIHGTMGNPLSQLCVQLGIETTDHLAECLLLDNEGWPVDAKQDDKMSQIFNQALEDTFERIEKIKEERKTQMIAPSETMPAVSNGNDKTGGNEDFPNDRLEKDPKKHAVDKGNEVKVEDVSDNFGHLFDKIATEQFGTTLVGSPLWNWQQANLELSCGTGFDNLGYTWNDDEAYGFEGAHVALKDSWRTVVEALAEPLQIVYESPVTAITIVEEGFSPVEELSNPVSSVKSETPSMSPTRKSRRLKGDLAEVRRSSRTSQKVQAFTVSSHSVLSYDDVTLDHPVRKRPREPTKVRVQLQNGSILQADAVVCSIPLGVLKKDIIRFTPPLPEPKRRAIQQLGCGLLNKCVLSFEQVFWQDSDFFGLAGETTPFLILNGHKITGKPILIFMFGGESAFDVDTDWTDADLVEECLKVLRKISKLTPPAPLDYIVTRWGQDQYARMSFSYVPPNVNGSEAFSAMSEPIVSKDGRPMVLFAGEHTTPFHPSTIHGAFLSGIREAYRLDLALEPRLNGYLAFDPNNLFQKTFSLRKKKDGSAPSKAVIDGALGRIQKEEEEETSESHGRRQGVMSLRKKKPTSAGAAPIQSPTRQSSRKTLVEVQNQQQQQVEPARKSARQSKTQLLNHHHLNNNESHIGDQHINGTSTSATASRPMLVSQDERTLHRLVQANFSNWQVIQSKVLPLYGCKSKKPSVLKQRYQRVRRSLRQKQVPVFADWKIGEAPSSQQLEQRRDTHPALSGERKSSRKTTPKHIPDM